MTKEIRLINAMLATTGTAPLAASDIRHPNYVKARNTLDDVLEQFSSMELWFNTSLRTLEPNTDNKILVPEGTMTCDPTDTSLDYSVRGRYLFDNKNYTYEIECPVECIVIVQLPLEDLPPTAYQYLRALARYEFFLDQDGATAKLDRYKEAKQKAEVRLIEENIKLADSNFFNSPAYIYFRTRRNSGSSTYSSSVLGRP